MVDYIIMFHSGSDIYGTINTQEAEMLKQAYVNKAPGVLEFNGIEGVFLLEMSNVIAILFNPVNKISKIGF